MVLPPRTVSTSDGGRAAQHHGQRPRRFSTADSSRPRTAAEAAAGRGPSLHNAAGRGGGQGASAARTDGHTHTHTHTRTDAHSEQHRCHNSLPRSDRSGEGKEGNRGLPSRETG